MLKPTQMKNSQNYGFTNEKLSLFLSQRPLTNYNFETASRKEAINLKDFPLRHKLLSFAPRNRTILAANRTL